MSWQEEVKKTSEFHFQKQKEHGESQTGRPRKGEKKSGWSIRDTADALGVSVRQVVEDLKLFKNDKYLHDKTISRKDALWKLQGKEIKVDREKFLLDSIKSALPWLYTDKKKDIKKAIEILEKAIE